MVIHVVGQATGSHGWSSFESYINGLTQNEIDVNVLRPEAEWGSSECKNDSGLLKILNSKSVDPIIFCGFDWHSQPIHLSTIYKSALNQYPGHKIGIFQEHLSAQWLKNDPEISNMFEKAALSASECLSHILCNHEDDVDYLKNLGIRSKIIFFPFFADLSYFKIKIPFEKRESLAFFRGKKLEFMGASPYEDRINITNQLSDKAEIVFEDLISNDLLNRNQMIESYVYDLNKYALQLNLPSLSNSITCRPFEIMACGGLLFQSQIEGEISKKILPKEFFVEYDRKSPQNLLQMVRSHFPFNELSSNIAKKGFNHIVKYHSAKIRVKNFLLWLNGDQSDSEFYKELKRKDTSLTNLKIKNKNNITVPKILIDLVFYQNANSGIAHVWNKLLNDWILLGFNQYVVLCLRESSSYSPPRSILEKYQIVTVPKHGSTNDSIFLQDICDNLNVTLFISTYYTYPITTPSLLLIHDCIPERINPNCLSEPSWIEKRNAINYSSGYFCISKNTANDLSKFYKKEINGKPIYLSYNEFPTRFKQANTFSINKFIEDRNLQKKYLLFVGERVGYDGYKNVKFIAEALDLVAKKRPDISSSHSILFLGGGEWNNPLIIEPEIEKHLYQWHIHHESVSDDLIAEAYSGASLLIYPSKIEGFGLPPGEAMMCGTPTLAWDSPINREIYQDSISYLTPGALDDIAAQVIKIIDNASNLKKLINKLNPDVLNRKEIQGGASQSGTIIECALLHAQKGLDLLNETYEPLLFECAPEQRKDWLERLIWGHPSEYTKLRLSFGDEKFKSAAIVSLYKGSAFIEGCIDDLIEQTDFQNKKMEIIIIDSASPENEFNLISKKIKKYLNIFYIRSSERESLYRAWNRGARYSNAKYLSNSNIDDRHRYDFFENLSKVLDNEEEVQLIYPAQYLTSNPNEPFYAHRPQRSWGWPDYSLDQLRIGNHVGSQPMWRRSLHEKIGYFNEKYKIAGDYDFWCRIAHDVGPLKLYPIHIGLYYFNPLGIEHGDPVRSEKEVSEICERYGIKKNYFTSASDKERDANGFNNVRNLEDLQYNGIVLNNSLNVILPIKSSQEISLDLFDEILSQNLATNHLIKIFVYVEDYSPQYRERFDLKIRNTLNNCVLINKISEINFDMPESCTILIKSSLQNKFVFEKNIQALYANLELNLLMDNGNYYAKSVNVLIDELKK